MDDNADIKIMLAAVLPENWRRRQEWMTADHVAEDNSWCHQAAQLAEVVDVTPNQPLWRLSAMSGASHWCQPAWMMMTSHWLVVMQRSFIWWTCPILTRSMYWRRASIEDNQVSTSGWWHHCSETVFCDNFVIFRHRSKRIAFLESVNFSTCVYMQILDFHDGHVTTAYICQMPFQTLQTSKKCCLLDLILPTLQFPEFFMIAPVLTSTLTVCRQNRGDPSSLYRT